MTALVPRGAPIAAIAPSGAYDPVRFAAGLAIAREAGHEIVPFDAMLQPERYLAAPDEVRLAHLVEALTSPDYAAVWMVRGGYGLTRLLTPLRERLPKTLPHRPILGFSDVTALFSALDGRTGPLVHAPVLHALPVTDEASRQALFHLLAGGTPEPLEGETWVPGEAEGRLVGGNLAMFAALCGTEHQLDARGAILVLEDIGEAPYRLDRMLQQLDGTGFFSGVHGIALGEFTACDPPAGSAWSLRDVLLDRFARLNVPVVAGLPIGHGSANRPFVWGAAARLARNRLEWSLAPPQT
jgi:muramoyltetrapeptide carboxypeptidase